MELKETIVRRVDFCDVDCTGAMWHGAYFKYYEDARCSLLKKLGFSYQDILREGFQIPIVSLKIKYSRLCRFDQLLAVTATLSKAEHMLFIDYEIRDHDTKEKMSTAETKHAVYNIEEGRALFDLPDFITEKLAKYNV